jgi:hypothetical protein
MGQIDAPRHGARVLHGGSGAISERGRYEAVAVYGWKGRAAGAYQPGLRTNSAETWMSSFTVETSGSHPFVPRSHDHHKNSSAQSHTQRDGAD